MLTFINFKLFFYFFKDDATVVVDNEIQQFRKELILGRAMNQQNGQINVEKGCGMEVCYFSNLLTVFTITTATLRWVNYFLIRTLKYTIYLLLFEFTDI